MLTSCSAGASLSIPTGGLLMGIIESASLSLHRSARHPHRPGHSMSLKRLSSLLLVVLAACSSCAPRDKAASAPCLPSEVPARQAPAPARDGLSTTRIYIDGSQSMSGYLEPSLGPRRPLADLLTLIAGREPNASYFAFGQAIHPIPNRAAIDSYAMPGPYNCRGCDNQESRIDSVLN